MTRSNRRLWITACGALLIGGAALASEPVPKTGAPPIAATPSADAQICTDASVSAQQREAALRDLSARLSALPPPPAGYRELNRTGLNYGRRSAPSTDPGPARK